MGKLQCVCVCGGGNGNEQEENKKLMMPEMETNFRSKITED